MYNISDWSISILEMRNFWIELKYVMTNGLRKYENSIKQMIF